MSENLLIVVDYQNDFVTGSLGFEKAKLLEDNICSKILLYKNNLDDIVFTLDTHTADYLNSQEGRNLPVEHCIKGTNGAKLYGKVNKLADENSFLIEKGTFGASGLAEFFKGKSYKKIELIGVVSNICVISNAVVAKTFQPEAVIEIDASCVASFDDVLNEKALDVMQGLQIKITNR